MGKLVFVSSMLSLMLTPESATDHYVSDADDAIPAHQWLDSDSTALKADVDESADLETAPGDEQLD